MAQRSLLADRRDSAIVASVIFARCTCAHEAKEAWARPMGAGDLLGYLGQRGVSHAGMVEAIFRHRDGVSAAMPFADQPSAWLEA